MRLHWAWALLAAYALELGLGGALFLWAFFALLGVSPVGLCGRGGVFSIRRSTSSSRFS